MAAKKTTKTNKKIPTPKPAEKAKLKPLAKTKGKAPVAKKVKERIPFYSTAGHLFNAAKDKRLARGTYATAAAPAPSVLNDISIRVGTPTKGTVFEGSLNDMLKFFFKERGMKYDPTAVSLPAPAHKAAPSAD